MIADVLCAQISAKDKTCVCCGASLKTASNFNKDHASCLKRMADRLPEPKRAEASQQKRRIRMAVNETLTKKTKRARSSADEEPLPKRRIMDADATSTQQILHQTGSRNEAIPGLHLHAIFMD